MGREREGGGGENEDGEKINMEGENEEGERAWSGGGGVEAGDGERGAERVKTGWIKDRGREGGG